MTDSMRGTASEQAGADPILVEIVAALRAAIGEASGRVERAVASLTAGNDQAAIGALAGLEVFLSDAMALQRAAIVLQRRTGATNVIERDRS